MLLNGVAGAEVGHERSAMQVAQKLVVDCHSQLQRADAHRRRLQLGTEFSIDSTTNSSDTLLNPNSYYALAQLQRSGTLLLCIALLRLTHASQQRSGTTLN